MKFFFVNGWAHGGVWPIEFLDSLGIEVTCISAEEIAYNPIGGLRSKIEQPSYLCGWSLGGMYGLAFAAGYPEFVSKLVLLSSTPRFSSKETGQDPRSLSLLRKRLRRDKDMAVKRFFEDIHGPSSLVRADLLEDELDMGLQFLSEAWLLECCSEVACPTLLVHGCDDELIPPAGSEELSRVIPESRLSLVPGAAHDLPFSKGREVAEKVKSFIGV